MKILFTRLLVTGALAVPLVAVGATAASAEPTNCTATPSGNTTRARCTSGTGQVRAGILCVVKGEFENDHYGPWVGIGATSTVTCPGGGRGVDWWYEIG
ncbi:hypothetical protein I0C86_14525 [Plantactinospora sp. S1510]|uniref:Secreted protein n=1 Tax=Plantactinospora alkalitolerans TaxID=2789879 RepID=A0ABS0GVD0_9ACTN|nr:hypothetical protein [Plantactinospora alkalitolerans]MBF9130161.1 hypothetical protein [Plantactinospora alkalitolerans]